jgi:hypothetical protein
MMTIAIAHLVLMSLVLLVSVGVLFSSCFVCFSEIASFLFCGSVSDFCVCCVGLPGLTTRFLTRF